MREVREARGDGKEEEGGGGIGKDEEKVQNSPTVTWHPVPGA